MGERAAGRPPGLGASDRDPGIAAEKQRRQTKRDERHAMREIIRRSLDKTSRDHVDERAAYS